MIEEIENNVFYNKKPVSNRIETGFYVFIQQSVRQS